MIKALPFFLPTDYAHGMPKNEIPKYPKNLGNFQFIEPAFVSF
jgi:hypothetical protein